MRDTGLETAAASWNLSNAKIWTSTPSSTTDVLNTGFSILTFTAVSAVALTEYRAFPSQFHVFRDKAISIFGNGS
jgi:hypothetical protein